MAKTPEYQTITPDKDTYRAFIQVRELTLVEPVSCKSADGVPVTIPAGTVLRVAEVV